MKLIHIKFPYLKQLIIIDSNIINIINQLNLTSKYDLILIVIDKNVSTLNPRFNKFISKITNSAELLKINANLVPKDFNGCLYFLNKFVKYKLTRESCVITIGGGLLCDILGFACSIYMRGIHFVQIPTTLMAMSDCIIGKVAVNFNNHKNLLGSFYTPEYVICDINFLKTLPEIEIIQGLVEIWKHAILTKNNPMNLIVLKYLNTGNKKYLNKLISKSISIKKKFVERDYNDKIGSHKALSLGHTFGNLLELKYHLHHGEAVLYGIILETILSYQDKLISKRKYDYILYIANLFEKKICKFHNIQKKIQFRNVIRHIKYDKINHHNSFTFVLLTDNGYRVKQWISEDKISQSISIFNEIVLDKISYNKKMKL